MATSSLVPLPQPDQPGLFNPTRALGGLSPLPPDASSRGSIDPDIAEVYFLVMHFLASGPCTRAFGQLWNELLQHKLLPRRFHAWYARDRKNSGNEDDDGLSLPLSYTDIVTRHPHVEPGHLVKLLQQLLVYNQRSVAALEPAHSRIPTAADVPTLLGAGAFSLLDCEYQPGNQTLVEVTVLQLKRIVVCFVMCSSAGLLTRIYMNFSFGPWRQ
jgi:hypothetical protein